jgi:uncharacterized membrane protein YqgA involved in biofilm formation
MIYVKSFLAGLAALILAALLGIGVLFAIVQKSSSTEGVGAIAGGAGYPLVTVSLLAFAADFFWQYRRAR